MVYLSDLDINGDVYLQITSSILKVDGLGKIVPAISGTDYEFYPTNLSFSAGTGILTLQRNGLSSLTTSLDGRYLTTSDAASTYLPLTGGTLSGNLLFSANNNAVSIGDDAANSNSGDYVIAIGFQAGKDNSGNEVIAIGYGAGKNNIAKYLFAAGNSAGLDNDTDHVIAIGYEAGLNNSYTNVNLFGQNTTATADGQMVFTKNGTIMARFGTTDMSNSRLLEFPDASGTIALVSDLTAYQLQLNGTGFVKASGTTITYDNSTYLTTSNAASTYLPISNISGTTNYIAKFTGANSLGNSLIYDDGTNVGIGTTSPNFPLTIERSSSHTLGLLNSDIGTAGQYTGLTFGCTGTTYQKGAIYYESQDGNGRGKMLFALNNVANSSNVSTSDTRMTIDYNGNVGIGTTAPSEKLEINGNTLISNNNFYKAKSLSGTAYSLAGITSGNVIQIGAIDYTSAGLTVAGGDNISFTTGGASGTERMKILNTGEINIASGLWKFTSSGLFEWGNNRGYLTWEQR